MMMKKMGYLLIIMISMVMTIWIGGGVGHAATIAEQCSDDFEKVTECLPYATAKAAAPTKECCDGVSEMKQSEPVCLCYFIQQTHNGTQQIKSLGIQEAKLLQLPSACKFTNASLSDCPKLLNITASSPEAAIFTNSSLTTPTTTTAPVTTGSSSGSKHGVPKSARVVLAAIATVIVFLCAFPAGVVSSMYT